MKILNDFIFQIKHFINCLYYFKSSVTKNVYPYKLVGEKLDPINNGTIILYKISGTKNVIEMSLKKLLNEKKIIERFHPVDAAKLGSIALKDIMFELEECHKEEKFYQIKDIMLNSTHDVYPSKKFKYADYYFQSSCGFGNDDYLDLAVKENVYLCKLVGGKYSQENNLTTIIFTIFGKRDGFEKPLSAILADEELLEKFHPTEAIKFGFISLGDSLFNRYKKIKNDGNNH